MTDDTQKNDAVLKDQKILSDTAISNALEIFKNALSPPSPLNNPSS